MVKRILREHVVISYSEAYSFGACGVVVKRNLRFRRLAYVDAYLIVRIPME
jgi:hypothetical protein